MDSSAAQDAQFKQLFNKEYSNLCRYALTYMQDTHAAEDVVQDTFIKIWEQKRDLIQSPEIKYYLVTAVRNNCISALRKLKSQQLQFTEETPEPEPVPFFTNTQQREMADEQTKRIANALDRLPPKCKEVFLLIKMQGMSYKQAADALDISIKTVENQMGKAIRLVRESPLVQAILILFMLMTDILWRPVGDFISGTVLK